MINENNVLEKVCEEKHKLVEDKLKTAENRMNENMNRLNSVEDAVIKLTNVVETIAKRNIFDKIMIVSIFLISIVLCAIILGPEITGRILGGVK
jgi:hypothetical protein